MMVIMRTDATPEQVTAVVERVESYGLRAHLSRGDERTIIGAIGDGRPVLQDQFLILPGVDRVVPISRPYKLASREFSPPGYGLPARRGEDRRRGGGDHRRAVLGGKPQPAARNRPGGQGGRRAGPARRRLQAAHLALLLPGAGRGRAGAAGRSARAHRAAGGHRGDGSRSWSRWWRTTPMCSRSGRATCRTSPCCTRPAKASTRCCSSAAMSATIEELLMAAEYILSHGNRRVILCERGIRTFETATRNTTDINAIPVLKSLTHLPVILDPSHSTGTLAVRHRRSPGPASPPGRTA